MGKLLTGRYGSPPDAESTKSIPLSDCNQKLGLKPSDFVSQDDPDFFRKSFGTHGHYLVLQLEPEELKGNPIWKPGYYLLPLGAIDVLKAFEKDRQAPAPASTDRLPLQIEAKATPTDDVLVRAKQWAEKSQPLFFKCGCPHLELRLDAPHALRRRWKARLRCPRRCQPDQTTLL
jgi:hypothetical protein